MQTTISKFMIPEADTGNRPPPRTSELLEEVDLAALGLPTGFGRPRKRRTGVGTSCTARQRAEKRRNMEAVDRLRACICGPTCAQGQQDSIQRPCGCTFGAPDTAKVGSVWEALYDVDLLWYPAIIRKRISVDTGIVARCEDSEHGGEKITENVAVSADGVVLTQMRVVFIGYDNEAIVPLSGLRVLSHALPVAALSNYGISACLCAERTEVEVLERQRRDNQIEDERREAKEFAAGQRKVRFTVPLVSHFFPSKEIALLVD